MKVTLFFSYGISLNSWAEAGLLQREIKLYRELIDCYDIEVSFLTYGGKLDRSWEQQLGRICLLPVYERFTYPRTKLSRVLQTIWIPWRFRRELIDSDILKTNQMMGAWVAIISTLAFRKPLLLRCGYELSKFLEMGNSSWWWKAGVWILSIAGYHAADKVHLATENDANYVKQRYRVNNAKIEIRSNWIDTDKFCPDPSSSKVAGRVLLVARLTNQKNVLILIEAIARTGLNLIIVGSGDQESLIRRRAQELNVIVTFQKNVSNNEMPKVYRSCSIFVLCSHYEGNPKALLEAMACGCAVLGTDVPGIRNIIHHRVNGLLVPKDVEALCEALMSLKSNPKLRQDLGNAAREQVLRENALRIAVDREWDAYSNLMPSRKHSS